MSLFSLDVVQNIMYRFSIQLIVVLALSLFTLKVWRHYCSNPSSFLHYIFLSFIALFLQSAVKLSVYSMRVLGAPELPKAVVPMLDHALKMGWVILFLYAFIVTISGMQFTKQYFLIANIFIMVFISSTVWLNWLQYLDTQSPVQGAFKFFWGELMLEAWIILLHFYGLFFARRVHAVMRSFFLLALGLLICRLFIHCWGIIASLKQLIWLMVVDRILLLLFVTIIMGTIYRYGKIVNGRNGNYSASLEQNSGPDREAVS